MSNAKEIEEVIESHNANFLRSVGDKIECRDENTCEILNEFLDTNPQMEFSYSLKYAGNQLGLTIDITRMSPLDQVRLNLRLISFLKEELQLVKNSI